jgi:hypothetical protein
MPNPIIEVKEEDEGIPLLKKGEVELFSYDPNEEPRPVFYTKDGDKVVEGEHDLYEDGPNEEGEEGGDEWLEIIRRGDNIIAQAIDELAILVWYQRCHLPMLQQFERGELQVVDKEEYEKISPSYEQRQRIIEREHWKGCLESGAKARAKLGGLADKPMDDFEWGMVNGKLSALRWVFGDNWDMLDT